MIYYLFDCKAGYFEKTTERIRIFNELIIINMKKARDELIEFY